MSWISEFVKQRKKDLKKGGKVVEKGLNDGAKTAGKAINDTAKTIEKGADDVGKTIEKAVQDTRDETGRAGKNLNEAAIASAGFIENQLQSANTTLSDAERRVREGKLVDAIWHVATDPITHTEDNVAKAVTESSFLNSIASAAASIYGGPAGSAAYAAWYTYKLTGDLELALKTAAIVGATSQGLKLVDGMPSKTTDQLTKKMIASASIGGAAVAASGGDEKEIMEAFLAGAALTAARETYSDMTDKEIQGRAPTESAVPKNHPDFKYKYQILVDKDGIAIMDANGNYQIDIRSMPRSVSHVGLGSETFDPTLLSGAETSAAMQSIAKLPYMNDMAYFHDQWAAVAQMSGLEVQATIVPATILTVAGSETPLVEKIVKANEQGAD